MICRPSPWRLLLAAALTSAAATTSFADQPASGTVKKITIIGNKKIIPPPSERFVSPPQAGLDAASEAEKGQPPSDKDDEGEPLLSQGRSRHQAVPSDKGAGAPIRPDTQILPDKQGQ